MVRFTKLLTFLLFIAFTACSNTSPQDNNSSEQTIQNTSTEQTENEPIPVAQEEEPAEAEREKNAEPGEVSHPELPKVKKVIEKTTPEPAEREKAPEKAEPAPPSHEAWDVLLQKYVSADGKVNYKGFLSSKEELESYLDFLTKNPVEAGASRAYKMAYWINAYNAFTIKLILDHYPVNSIKDIHNGDPWNVKWIKLGDKNYSLNNIENDILRPKYKDARIHFAVNCAAKSCPPLLNRAWSAGKLEKYLDRQAKAFINNPKYNKISANKVQISKIFEWYADDFGNVIDYLNKYSDTKINADAKVTYLEYDWGLNN